MACEFGSVLTDLAPDVPLVMVGVPAVRIPFAVLHSPVAPWSDGSELITDPALIEQLAARVQYTADVYEEIDPFSGHVEYWPGAKPFTRP